MTYQELQDRYDADMLRTRRSYSDDPVRSRDRKRTPAAKAETITRKQQRAAKRVEA